MFPISEDPSRVMDGNEQASLNYPVNHSAIPLLRDLTYAQIILWSAVIGILGGLVATAYYYLLEHSMHLVWHTLPERLAL
jgi:hypothetical protein